MKNLSINKFAKIAALFSAILLSVTFSRAQDITGEWNGIISLQGGSARLLFIINKTENGYMTTMGTSDPGTSVSNTIFDGSKLSFTIPNNDLSYEGVFKSDSIVGTFKRSTLSMPMTLKRSSKESE